MSPKSATHAVGIDLGTTYSCLSFLTPQGQPQTLPNAEGELSTPSVVFFEGEDAIVGTEALRNSVACPDRVVMHAKRHMGDPKKNWVIDGRVYTPVDVSAFIIRKLLDGAEEHLRTQIKRAVITVPALFSEIQRQWTVVAGLRAGLEHVDVINEPVAAALCHVLSDGMWFAALANDQTVMVFDLGGGTFDLSLVKYNQNEVRVKASGGDLNLGGLDWNKALETFACDQFAKETGHDPRLDRESMQALTIEVEQVKRALSVRPKASLMLQHSGRRKTYGLDREQFELLTRDLVKRTENITLGMLKANRLGWQNVDAVLVTGGASRMPMVRDMLNRVSGTTLNTTLSPDQSISHGAAYYAGMILSGQSLETSSLNKEAKAKLGLVKQHSVNARGLGILVREMETGNRMGHFLIPANTPLPTAYRQRFGTVVPNQKRVSLHIVESGTSDTDAPVELGLCVVDGLPENLPIGSPIEVTIRYDEQARVHVEARELVSGVSARTTIVRRENVNVQNVEEQDWSNLDDSSTHNNAKVKTLPIKPQPVKPQPVHPQPAKQGATPRSPNQAPVTRPVTPQGSVSGQAKTAVSGRAPTLETPTETAPTPASSKPKPSTFVPHPGTGAKAPPTRSASTPARSASPTASSATPPKPKSTASGPPKVRQSIPLEEADRPVPLCNQCGEPLDLKGQCVACRTGVGGSRPARPTSQPPAGKKPASKISPPRPKGQ